MLFFNFPKIRTINVLKTGSKKINKFVKIMWRISPKCAIRPNLWEKWRVAFCLISLRLFISSRQYGRGAAVGKVFCLIWSERKTCQASGSNWDSQKFPFISCSWPLLSSQKRYQVPSTHNYCDLRITGLDYEQPYHIFGFDFFIKIKKWRD